MENDNSQQEEPAILLKLVDGTLLIGTMLLEEKYHLYISTPVEICTEDTGYSMKIYDIAYYAKHPVVSFLLDNIVAFTPASNRSENQYYGYIKLLKEETSRTLH